MLQNQYKEQEPEPDLFSVLEPIFTQSLNHNLMLTRPLDMDVVLKDHLQLIKIVFQDLVEQQQHHHLEESMSKKAGKCSGSEGVKWESCVERKDVFKAAKNALGFGARDAINEFCKQGMALIDIFEDECDDEDGGQLLF
ncbi:hypothetical protein L2E82_50192 [Cichorium intybus]|nr:hypothetical protein L2E82_50192 [Cichorium intybus]